MKTWIRRIAIAAFVLSFAPIVPRVGKVLAQPAPDFIFNPGAHAQITYETAALGNCTTNPYHVISCDSFIQDSDSYSVNAGINVLNAAELGQDLTNNGLWVVFFAGNDRNGDPLSAQLIPGNAMHTTTPHNGKFTIYSFEGNVPNRYAPPLALFFGFPYDHLEMNLMVDNDNLANSALHIQANANLCDWGDGSVYTPTGTPLSPGQAASMAFQIGSDFLPLESPDGDGDSDCVNLTPEVTTKDISSAACFSF